MGLWRHKRVRMTARRERDASGKPRTFFRIPFGCLVDE